MIASSRRRARVQNMFAVIEKYLASDVTQKEFCQQENLSYSTFQFWLHKYRKANNSCKNNESSQAPFVPINFCEPNARSSHQSCTIEFPNGVVVRFSETVDVRYLSQLVHNTVD